jgi:hypothetical protein
MSYSYGIRWKYSCYSPRFLIKGAVVAELTGGTPSIPQKPLSVSYLTVEIPVISF